MNDVDPYLLLVGYRQRLLDNGIEPVVLGPLQGSGPGIGLTHIPLVDDDTTGNVLASVQVHFRGDATAGIKPVLDWQRDIRSILSFEATQVGGHLVVKSWRQTSAPIAPDAAGRPEGWDTYYLRTDRLGRS